MPLNHAAAADQLAVRMLPGTSPGFFPPDDPRAGDYQPGEIYLKPIDVAEALLDGGGFELVETDEPTPEAAEEGATL